MLTLESRRRACSVLLLVALSQPTDSALLKPIAMHCATAPLRRNVSIDDVGNAASFLMSDLANGITAEIIYVDNGFSQVVGGMDEA